MAQPPKTPAPPRRKAATRKTTRTATRKPATPKTDSDESATAAAPPKPAAQRQPAVRKTSRAKTAAGTVAKTVADSASAQFVSDTREKMGDRNFFAALIGGVAAIGAAVAGVVIALRDGDPDGPAKAKGKGGPKKG